jgi:hypothetical protein
VNNFLTWLAGLNDFQWMVIITCVTLCSAIIIWYFNERRYLRETTANWCRPLTVQRYDPQAELERELGRLLIAHMLKQQQSNQQGKIQ